MSGGIGLQSTAVGACLRQALRGTVQTDAGMAALTTVRIGGPAALLIKPADSLDLQNCLRILRRFGIRWRIVGCGSNLLVDDQPLPLAIIMLTAADFRVIQPQSDGCVLVGAGVRVAALLNYCRRQRLSGLEFMAGIPASVGGALAMNAGGRDILQPDQTRSIWQAVCRVQVLDPAGELSWYTPADEACGYRHTWLLNSEDIVLAAALRLQAEVPGEVAQRIAAYAALKWQTQDLSLPSAGCVFKNPVAGPAAGWLIDRCGLKGYRCGDAVISRRHANFILNAGRADYQQVRSLMACVQGRVWQAHGLWLEPELQIITAEG